jgi:hypothetical protein
MKALTASAFKAIPGKSYATPQELWGFRSERGRGTPRSIAWQFLEANREHLGISSALDRLDLRRVIHGLGADHVIYQQIWRRRRIHRAYVTVHIGRDGRVYLVKSRAVAEDILRQTHEPTLPERRAVRLAFAAVGHARGSVRVVGRPELLWYPSRRLLHPAWRVRVHRTRPRAEVIVYVHAITGRIISRVDNLAEATGRATVFLPNPMSRAHGFQPLNPTGRVQRPPENAYVAVTLTGLRSRRRLDGRRVNTQLTRQRVSSARLDFVMPSTQAGFEEVSSYYHVNEAIAYLEKLGYRGSRRIFADPIRVNARGTRDDNSWYSPGERTLTFGTGDIDDAEDGETVLHDSATLSRTPSVPTSGRPRKRRRWGKGSATISRPASSRRESPTPTATR